MNSNVGTAVEFFLLAVTHSAAGLITSPVVSAMPFPLNDALRAGQAGRKLDTDFVVAHWPGSWDLPSV